MPGREVFYCHIYMKIRSWILGYYGKIPYLRGTLEGETPRWKKNISGECRWYFIILRIFVSLKRVETPHDY